jgi:hypothetical protein
MSISIKEKKEYGAALGELFTDGGSDTLMELYNGMTDIDWPKEVLHALNEADELGEEIESYMNIYLAKKFAKDAGGKFIPHGGIK